MRLWSCEEGDRGLLSPSVYSVVVVDTSVDASTTETSWDSASVMARLAFEFDVSPLRIFQGKLGSSRTTIRTPGVPAHRWRMGIFRTQELQMRAS